MLYFFKDSNGNTLLHVLVINNKLDMFMYASNHPIRKAHSNIKNAQELTPINLAAKLGREELFTKMLEINVMVKKIIFFKEYCKF